jgi:hypothetical protein
MTACSLIGRYISEEYAAPIFGVQDWGSIFIQNIGTYLPDVCVLSWHCHFVRQNIVNNWMTVNNELEIM